jgi:hypothetical protein
MFLVGLDLGQTADPSALAVLEVMQRFPAGAMPDPDVTPLVNHYNVRHLRRWPLGTSYVDIVKDVTALLERPPLPGARLVVDATGVGRAVVDLFLRTSLRPNLTAVTITAGHRALPTKGGWNVCKKDLAGALQAALGQGRLKVADLPEREQLFHELRTFSIKVNRETGNESFEALCERDHDDLVLAVALPLWLHEKTDRAGPALRIYSAGQRIGWYGDDRRGRNGPPLRMIVCSRGELPQLPLERPAALLYLADPEPVGRAGLPEHALLKLEGALALSFADLDAEEHAATWNEPVPPYNRPARELMMSAADGKRLWAFVSRTFKGHYQAPPNVLLIADGGGGDEQVPKLAPRADVVYRVQDGGEGRAGAGDCPGRGPGAGVRPGAQAGAAGRRGLPRAVQGPGRRRRPLPGAGQQRRPDRAAGQGAADAHLRRHARAGDEVAGRRAAWEWQDELVDSHF